MNAKKIKILNDAHASWLKSKDQKWRQNIFGRQKLKKNFKGNKREIKKKI